MKNNMVSAVIGILIGSLAALGHVQSVEAHKTPVVKVEPIEVEHEEQTIIWIDDEDIPDEVEKAAYRYGQEYDICPEFLEAIAYYESRYIADVEDASGTHIGLMQISTKWHKDRMKKLYVTDLKDADQNMHVAADYLAELFLENEDPAVVLMMYNGDQSWRQGKISSYANKVLKLSEELEIKHGKGH